MISYFTDGSASPNPGPGGFAVIKNGAPYIYGGEPEDSEISRKMTTNIRMEARAIFAAMDDFVGEKTSRNVENETAVLTTDSQFWINVLTIWAPNWEKKNWEKKGGIKNLDLVKPLFAKYQIFRENGGEIKWTKAHVGTRENELADEWANRARAEEIVGAKFVDEK